MQPQRCEHIGNQSKQDSLQPTCYDAAMNKAPFLISVLISGNGSNLQALIDASNRGAPYQIASVISNKPDAYGLQRAQQAGIDHHSIDHRQFPDRASFESALIKQLNQDKPDLIVLAGFMRKLTPVFIRAFPQRIINIHPSLLPKYPGLNTHQRAIDAGDSEHGVSIHIVNEDLDAGPLLAQARCSIDTGDTAEQLAHKVHLLEYQLYPQVVSDIATAKIELSY